MGAVLVTGSSKGLGRSLSLIYAFNGYDIILHGRDILKLEQVERDVCRYGVTCQVVVGDLRDEKIIDELVACAKTFDIGILINNAGVYLQKSVGETTQEEIKYLTDINLMTPIKLTQRIFEEHFKKHKYGQIININSVAVRRSGAYESVYCMSKSGLKGFMDSFQFETLKHCVTILNIYLGAIQTDMTSERRDSEKFMKTKEVADLIYLLSKNYSSLRVSEIEILRKIY